MISSRKWLRRARCCFSLVVRVCVRARVCVSIIGGRRAGLHGRGTYGVSGCRGVEAFLLPGLVFGDDSLPVLSVSFWGIGWLDGWLVPF